MFKLRWCYLNEVLFDFMSCGVEKQWFDVINSLLQCNKVDHVFAVRKKKLKCYGNLLVYALQKNHKKTFRVLVNIFLDRQRSESSQIDFSLPCNFRGDTLLHLLVRYDAFHYLSSELVQELLPYFDMFMNYENFIGQTVLLLACELCNKTAIVLFIRLRVSLLNFFIDYYRVNLNFEMLEFLHCNYSYLCQSMYIKED